MQSISKSIFDTNMNFHLVLLLLVFYPLCRNEALASQLVGEPTMMTNFRLHSTIFEIHSSARVLYNCNSTVSFHPIIKLIHDIELNPGPFQNNEPTLTNNLSPNCNTTSSTMNNNLHFTSVTTNMYKDLPLPFKDLNFCHLNVQPLTNKLDEIKLILSNRISSSKSNKSNFYTWPFRNILRQLVG